MEAEKAYKWHSGSQMSSRQEIQAAALLFLVVWEPPCCGDGLLIGHPDTSHTGLDFNQPDISESDGQRWVLIIESFITHSINQTFWLFSEHLHDAEKIKH